MSVFKGLFSFENTGPVHLSVIVVSFLVWMASIFFVHFFVGIENQSPESIKWVFRLFSSSASEVRFFSGAVFFISYLVSFFMNSNSD